MTVLNDHDQYRHLSIGFAFFKIEKLLFCTILYCFHVEFYMISTLLVNFEKFRCNDTAFTLNEKCNFLFPFPCHHCTDLKLLGASSL